MNKNFSKKLLSLIILGLLSPASVYAIDKKECNSTDNLEGWGIWCGVDTYLSKQESTAAGPVDGGSSVTGLPAIDGDEFGGSLTEESPFNWSGYAYVNVNRLNDNIGEQAQPTVRRANTYLTGILQLQLEPETNTINVIMTLEDGSKITFNQQAQFITPQFGPDSSYGEFQVVSEDGKYQINALPALAIGNFYQKQGVTNDTVTSGGIRNIQGEGFRVGGFVAGSPTPLSDMSNLAVNNIQATYSGLGDYRSSYGGRMRVSNDITVNFGDASWQGNWYGMPFGGFMGSVNAQGDVSGNTFSSNNITSQGYMMPPPIGPQP
ncbi:MAG: hypothetical protein R3254_03515, partial [Thiomicrorhabdus sp.]|nr:hypothetical protein [Thiomicrorhabdus sp.]